MIKVIDLFAGCGGFSIGFEKAGYDIISAVEFDKNIAKSYEVNHPKTKMIADDIKNVDNNNIFKKNDATIIIGGPPCQGFSMAGARIRKGFIDDPRNYLFKHYFNVVKIVRPKIFIIENVKGILTMKKGQIFNEIKKIFEDPDNFEGKPYKIQYKVMKAKEYGIPQNRERTIIVGSMIDFNLDEEINKTKEYIKGIDKHFFDNVTVWQAISNLPKPTEDGNIKIEKIENNYQKFLSSNSGKTFNHIMTKHNSIAVKRMEKIGINQNFTVLNEKIKTVHSGSYGRLDPDSIAPTITTRFDTPSGGRFIHPFENRTITPREAARIQSFPDDFEFIGTKSCICKQIGNAVPPKLSYFLGTMIRRILENDQCRRISKNIK
jgi:DNA (cytosine-5)-methyltransferase 1